MKESLKRIIDTFHRYNTEHMAAQVFGFNEDLVYDALVVAPTFTPYSLFLDKTCKVTTLKEGAYRAGYMVEKDGTRIAWIKIGSSAGNLIDCMTFCAELSFKRMIFVGAVGGLKESFKLGDVCTPSFSISGSHADTYLMKESIRESMLFTKVVPDMKYVDKVIEIGEKKGYHLRKAGVFCTPSIALEYAHLDEIKSFDTDLIEMETSSFYLMADLFELPGIALLVVSDNSASGAPFAGRTEEQQEQYEYGRNVVLPDMIITLASE